ncbi:MAG: hypothetical protein WA678_07190 [Rhabdochlamydiaceae bacterium]|jgi:hypothetical protein
MSDMEIDSSDEMDGVYDDLQSLESNSNKWESNKIWNGREVFFLKFMEKKEEILKIIRATSIQNPRPLQTREIEQLNFDKQEDELDTIEDLLTENGYEFDTDLGISEDCKSVMSHVKHAVKATKKAVKKTGKAVEKCAKKVAKVGKKVADEVCDFVTEHKKELIIAAAIVAAAAIAAATLGTGSGAGAAAIGAAGGLASDKKKEDDDSPNPEGIDTGSSAPPDPEPSAPHSVPDRKITEFSSPISVPPPVIKSPFANFLESFNRDKISPEPSIPNPSFPVFNHKKDDHFFNHKSDHLQTEAIPIPPAQTSVSRFLETLRLGAAIIERGMCEPELLNPNSPLDQFFKSDPDNSTGHSTPPTGPTITTFFQTIEDALSKGFEAIGRCYNPFDLFNKTDIDKQKSAVPLPENNAFASPNAFTNFSKALSGFPEALAPEITLPDNSTGHSTPPTGPTITTFFQTIQDTLSKGFEAIGRCYNPFDLFNKTDIDKQKSAIPLPENIAIPTPNAFAFPNAFTNFSKALSGIPEIFAPEITSPNEFSRLYKTEGISRDDMCIIYINGINTTPEEALANAEHIRKFMPDDLCINGIYNHSNCAPTDVAEVLFCNYWGFSPGTQELCHQLWTEFHEKNKENPNQKFLQFCSSQGAIHTENALMKVPQEIRDRAIVIGIGPAATVSEELCYASFDFASKKDFIYLGEYIFKLLIASFNDESEQQELLQKLLEKRKQLILLTPHENATGIDHSPQSPTFNEVYERQLRDYFEHKGAYP